MKSVASCSWGHAPEPPAHTQASSWHSKALERFAPGNANARAEITALSEIMGGSSKCYLYSLSGECGGFVEECVNKSICVLATGKKRRGFRLKTATLGLAAGSCDLHFAADSL